MSVRFTHLKIAGFKSFSDPITLEILPGLTGIIGPNGCGKSNIVEAIRWVMGESSAKSLRGGEMDDVIFAGTARRAARNIAEVALTIEGTEHVAPAPFQHQDQLQISRQLERGSGSQYRINSKVQRARDVQTFFADLGSGPRSSAIISQNRIAQLISASPEERRQVLEEAAGIAGLYSRRREAELKLKATEENLARLEDLQQQLILLIVSLNEQSSQATIYRRLSTELREAEKQLQSLYFQRAIRSVDLFKHRKLQAQNSQNEAELNYTQQRAQFDTLEKKLPELRQHELQSRAQLDHQRQQTRYFQEKQNKVLEQITYLKERIQEATEQHENAVTRMQKAQIDYDQLIDNLRVTENKLQEQPNLEKTSRQKIDVTEKEIALVNSQILEQQKKLEEQQQHCQTITQQYTSAKLSLEQTEAAHQKISGDYEYCLSSIPKQEEIQGLTNQQQDTQLIFKKLQEQKQQTEIQLNEAKMQASTAQHHLQQVETAFNQLQSKIAKEEATLQDYMQKQKGLESQLQNLNNQSLSEQTKTELLHKLEDKQKEYVELKNSLTSASINYQAAIKKHLETDAAYQLAIQTYQTCQVRLQEHQQSIQKAQDNLQHLAQQVQKAEATLVDPALLEEKQAEYASQQDSKNELHETVQKLNADHNQALVSVEEAQKKLNQINNELQQLQAKRNGLASALFDNSNQEQDPLLPAILDSISLPPEWIVPISVIFDETLESPESIDAKTGWVELPPCNTNFPINIRKLSDIITPPPVLQRAFEHIGVVDTAEQGHTFFRQLTHGQTLISKDGDLWRWDGYHQKAGLKTRAAQRLIQREALKNADNALAQLQQSQPILETQHQTELSTLENIKNELHESQQRYKIIEQTHIQTQQELFALNNQAQSAKTQFESLQPAYTQAKKELEEKQQAFVTVQQQASLPQPDPIEIQISKENEQNCSKLEQHAQEQLQIIESTLDDLKKNYQQKINDDQQNHLRVENLKERISQFSHDIDNLHTSVQQDHENLLRLEHPKQAQDNQEKAQNHVQTLEAQHVSFQKELADAEHANSQAQLQLQDAKNKYIQQNSRLEALKPQFDESAIQYKSAKEAFIQTENSYTNLPDLEPLQSDITTLRNMLEEYKTQVEEERLNYHLLLNEKQNLINGKNLLENQIQEWKSRLSETQTEEKNASGKTTQLQKELSILTEELPYLEQQLNSLKEIENTAGANYQATQQLLIEFEQDRANAHKNLQLAEQNYNKTKENLFKAQAKEEQAEALLSQLENNIDPTIQDYAEQQTELDISDSYEKKLKAVIMDHSAEREALGAVNLRAEIEREEKQEQLNSIEKEFNELAMAIQQLRESIQKLNQQGKEKLHTIFTEVDQHFQELFTRMFNGGSAYLKLLAHEDPLQSGLEIYAQPPGKKLSTLSLLSGGEQALTALSLVFAVSRCNPVPICILDEVDAPLDDPNVERFCSLLSDMTEQAGTRFLVVTHHQLTMSHMNRLYGVTMQERGVSQIISIDLEHAVLMQQDKTDTQLDLI